MLVGVQLAIEKRTDEYPIPELMGDLFLLEAYASIPDIDRDAYFQSAEDNEFDEVDDGEEEDSTVDASADEREVYRSDDDVDLIDKGREMYVRVVEDLDAFNETLVEDLTESGNVRLNLSYAEPIHAIMLDAKVRYGYTGDSLSKHVFGALDVARLYDLEEW